MQHNWNGRILGVGQRSEKLLQRFDFPSRCTDQYQITTGHDSFPVLNGLRCSARWHR